MSDSKHTPEPMFQHEFRQLATYENGRTPVLLTEDQYRRAKACVNACAGIPTSRLEAGAVEILAYSMELKKQRDDLLSILKAIIECGYLPELPEPSLLTKSHAAIAIANSGVKKCETCNGEGGYEVAASSTSYFWKDCLDCTATKSSGQPEEKPENETTIPAIVFYPAGSLGEEVE